MAYEQSLDAEHISSDLGNYEAARSGFFSLSIPSSELGNLYSVNYNRDTTESSKIYNSEKAAEYLRLNVTKVSIPNFELATHEYRRGNNVVNYAGVPTYNGGSFVVDDIIGLETKSLLYSWLYLAYDPRTRKGGRMKDYKKEATLTEYTQDFKKVREWKLHGIFIYKIDEDDLDRENDGPRKLKVSFKVDWAEMSTIGAEDTALPVEDQAK